MTVSTTSARHRAARRPSTPLTEFAAAASDQMGTVGRRTAVVAASSGLIVSMLGSSASATGGEAGALPAVDTAALTASARAVLNTAPVVTAPVDAAWTFDVPVVTAETPPPPPPPVKVKAAASRSTTRAAAAVATTETTNAAVPQSVAGNAVLEVAARYVGTPYVSGGSTPDGFDCSGFVSYVYAQLGISLPRTSSGIKAAGTVISRADAQPGDLIWSPGHISIYAGGNDQIDSPRPGKTIQFRAIWQSSPVFIRIG
ncbi:C40 family peptidase [Cellulomonas sp.]|uniref:C40 family peptidase n=1 Tax=Cellulomonas sp. TaxID=40001 RepID=UPI003BABCC4A